jgi:adenine-specific DNA-methyltransferase
MKMGTQGIKYTGSKRLIIPKLLQVLQPLQVNTVLDGFSGTTRVSQALKMQGYKVIANDIAEWSRVFGECYLLNTKPADYYQPMINHLNALPGKYGWFSKHYGGNDYSGSAVQPDGTKRIWQLQNTKKLDSIRNEIDKITKDPIERSVLLTSLILALDKVDSSVGHQVSYLKKWAPRSYNAMALEVPKLLVDDQKHQVFQEDIFDLIQDVAVDVAYFDPPYGSSNELMPSSRVRYASYYHIWKTICLNDRPVLVGVANRREDVGDKVSGSVFEEFRKNKNGKFIATEAITRLLEEAKAKTIILSYNNNGRATSEAILDTLSKLKLRWQLLEMDYKTHVMAAMKWTNTWLNDNVQSGSKEYLFVIEKTPSGATEIIKSFKQPINLSLELEPA